MESDAMAVVNYYYPKRIDLKSTPEEANLILPEMRCAQPLYGSLILGNSADSLISVVLDESVDDQFSFLYVDKNNNEDLTDDDNPQWDEEENGYWFKEELVDVYYRDDRQKAPVPYTIKFYRHPKRMPKVLVAFRNGYREGAITLKDTTYKVALFDDDLDGLFQLSGKGAIIIDINRDGVLNGRTDSPEYFTFDDLFNIRGETYRIKRISPAGDVLTLTTADSAVAPKRILTAGQNAPDIRTTSLQGTFIDLNAFKNKVVLIDFWATWCKPWQNELGILKRSYQRYHPRGFEIIGVSLDYDLDTLREFLQSNDIRWGQVATGEGWRMDLVRIFNVQAVPKNFLLDRNGVIRFKDVHGNHLGARIFELLNEPEVVN